MMKTYNSFSLRRVGLLVKRDVVENWKRLLFSTLGLSFAFLLLMYLSYTTYDNTAIEGIMGGADEVYARYCLTVQNNCTSVLGFYVLFILSGFMSNMQTKGERINVLMLPAKNIEKFVSRALYLFLCIAITYVFAILLADILHMIIFPFLENASKDALCGSLIPGFWHAEKDFYPLAYGLIEGEIGVSISVFMAFGYMLSACNRSFFILGGCYWRKHHFIKTFALMMSISIALVVALGFAYSFAVSETGGAPVAAVNLLLAGFFGGLDKDTILCIFTSVFFVWTLLNWWLAYRLFRRSQIV